MRILSLALILVFAGCKVSRRTTPSEVEFTPMYVTGPHVMVYKTRANYDKLVPVQLSDDKTQVSSYPDPRDVITEKGYAYPTALHNGYLLDNRGIGQNTAFLKMTYEQYAKLSAVPTSKELLDMIIDKDPLTELIDCGSRTAFTDIPGQLNQLIDNKQIRNTCKTIK